MIRFLLALLLTTSLTAEPFLEDLAIDWKNQTYYDSVTKRFLEHNPYHVIDSSLSSQGVTLRQKEFYFNVINSEERGHIGYHASNQSFRVFQDIIRITFEEVLKLEFKRDFYFFRVPGDPMLHNYNTALDFLKSYLIVNDNLEEQRDQLISVNFTPFNNYKQKYECTAVFFEKSISYKPPIFEGKIEFLFKQLGMSTSQIKTLFSFGNSLNNGVLFQFFDFSFHEPVNKNPYQFLYENCYQAEKKGVPVKGPPPSSIFEGPTPPHHSSQYRIVVNHGKMLNPYGNIWMRRYDLNSQSTVEDYERNLRETIRNISFDPIKADIYKKKLMQSWTP